MKPRLPQQLAERRHTRRGLHRRRSGEARLPRESQLLRAPKEAPAPAPERPADAHLDRARAAGGPTDRASYACSCGYVFWAPVSTTVSCPHCSSQQAW